VKYKEPDPYVDRVGKCKKCGNEFVCTHYCSTTWGYEPIRWKLCPDCRENMGAHKEPEADEIDYPFVSDDYSENSLP